MSESYQAAIDPPDDLPKGAVECPACKGEGCDECEWRGLIIPVDVEQFNEE